MAIGSGRLTRIAFTHTDTDTDRQTDRHTYLNEIIYMNGKIPEGQVYAPRLEPVALIRLADRNHMRYLSRRHTILKKDGSMMFLKYIYIIYNFIQVCVSVCLCVSV